jgi:hypothetical protein
MATQLTGIVRSFTADAAITKNRVVKITSTGVDVATADTDKVIGVSTLTVATGDQCPVQLSGTCKITASAAISAGDLVVATTGGKIATTTTDKKRVIGTALEAATADGDLIEVLLTPTSMTSL